MIKRTDYAQNCVLARVYEKRIIDRAKFDRMIDAKTPDEVFRLLMETEYSKSTHNVNNIYDYDELLGNEIQRIDKIAKELLLDNNIAKLLAYKYEFHNLRVIAKEIVVDKNFEHLYLDVCSFNPKFVKEQSKIGRWGQMEEYVSETIQKALSAYDVDHNPQAIDFAVDRMYFKTLVETSIKIDSEMIRKYVKGLVDFYNVGALLRAQKHGVANLQNLDAMLVEGGDISISKLKALMNSEVDRVMELVSFGEIGRFMMKGLLHYKEKNSLESFEDSKEDYLSALCQQARYESFGPEPIFAYLVCKQKELAKVRIVVISKLNGIPAIQIRERLGDDHV